MLQLLTQNLESTDTSAPADVRTLILKQQPSGVDQIQRAHILDQHRNVITSNAKLLPSITNMPIAYIGEVGTLEVAARVNNAAIVSCDGKAQFKLAHIVHVEDCLPLDIKNQSAVYLLCNSRFGDSQMSETQIANTAHTVAKIVEHRINTGKERYTKCLAGSRSASHAGMLLNINNSQYRTTKEDMQASAVQFSGIYTGLHQFIYDSCLSSAGVSSILTTISLLTNYSTGTQALVLDYLTREAMANTSDKAEQQLKAMCIIQALKNTPMLLTTTTYQILVAIVTEGLQDNTIGSLAPRIGASSRLFTQIAQDYISESQYPRDELKLSIICLHQLQAPVNGLAAVQEYVCQPIAAQAIIEADTIISYNSD